MKFIGESAVDDGGPRREYFKLLLHCIATKSGLFQGWPGHVMPVHNLEALASNRFFLAGKMIATCLVQGGQPPVFFSAPVADYLVFKTVRSEACLDDIHDYEVRLSLEKVMWRVYTHVHTHTHTDDTLTIIIMIVCNIIILQFTFLIFMVPLD